MDMEEPPPGLSAPPAPAGPAVAGKGTGVAAANWDEPPPTSPFEIMRRLQEAAAQQAQQQAEQQAGAQEAAAQGAQQQTEQQAERAQPQEAQQEQAQQADDLSMSSPFLAAAAAGAGPSFGPQPPPPSGGAAAGAVPPPLQGQLPRQRLASGLLPGQEALGLLQQSMPSTHGDLASPKA